MNEQTARPAPRGGRGRREAAALATGSAIGGALAYVFFVLVIRALGAEPAAPVTVLWAWWGFAGAALTFPVQHWIARTSATEAGEAQVRRGLPHVAAAVLAMSVLAGGLAWWAHERLFGADGEWFALLVLGVGIGSGLLGLPRGLLSGRRRFVGVAASIVAENAVRCVVAAALAIAGVEDPLLYGYALLAGYASIVLWPGALVPRRVGTSAAGAPGRPLSFVSGASASQLIAQATLTGGPVVVAAIGGAPVEVTVLFAGLALFRAPYTLALGLVSALTGRLTQLVEAADWGGLARIRRVVLVGAVLLCALGAGLGAWWGPPVMELVFGAGVRLGTEDAALVAVGTVLAMANLVLTVGLLARNRAGAAFGCWAVGIPFGVLVLGWVGTDPVNRVCWTFVAVEVVAFAALWAAEIGSDHFVGRQEDRGTER